MADLRSVAMPTPVRMVVKLPSLTGLPKDTVENTFCAILPTAPYSASESATMATAVANFYNQVPPGAALAIKDCISDVISRLGFAVLQEVYDLTPGPGVGVGPPKNIYSFGLNSPTGAPVVAMPSEVALCLSIHANSTGIPEHGTGGTRPKARYRGRIYIGPVGVNMTDQDPTTHQPLPQASFVTTLKQAGTKLLSDLAAAGITWAVRSGVDHVMRGVIGGSVDNAWDIQRRRGELPTVKSTWGATTFSLEADAQSLEVASL